MERALLLALTVLAASACAPRRILSVDSYPPGATVRLDNVVIGETPLEYRFKHYGTRRVTLYRPGYRTWSERVVMKTPWYSAFPIDIVTEILLPVGWKDQHRVWVILEEDVAVSGEPDDMGPLLTRASEMRLRGTERTPPEPDTPGDGSRP